MERQPMSLTGINRARNKSEAGYTLLEVMVVLAILAVVAGAVPAMIRDASPRLRLEAQAAETLKDLAYLRARTRLEGTPGTLLVAEDGHSYRLGGREIRLADKVSVTLGGSEKASAALSRSAITFYPEGGSSGGRVILSSGDVTETITIDWLTSAIRIGAIARVGPS